MFGESHPGSPRGIGTPASGFIRVHLIASIWRDSWIRAALNKAGQGVLSSMASGVVTTARRVSGHLHRLQDDRAVKRVVQLVRLRGSGRGQGVHDLRNAVGSNVQSGSTLAAAQTPKLNGAGTDVNALA